MATAASYNKAPPLRTSCKSYSDWKKLIEIWTELTSLDKKKQGPALVLTLEGKAQEAALELSSEEISSETGVTIILRRLDKVFEKDKLTEKFNAIEKFESYKRTKENKIRDFLVEFDKRLHKIKNYITYPNDLLAYRLLKAANLEPTHEKLIKATITDLNYEEVRNKLVKVFAEDAIQSNFDDLSTLKIKSEPTFYTKDSDGDQSSEEEGVYFVKKHQYNRGSSKSGSQSKYNYWNSERDSNTRSRNEYSKYDKRTEKPKAKNPLDKNGRVTRCTICDSVNHWQQDCPDKGNGTYIVHEIVLHNKQDEPGNLRHLVSETWNCGLLDCGASKTVCGEIWLQEYMKTLSDDEKRDIRNYNSKSLYRFGDGGQVQATRGISIPAFIGNTKVQINSDVVQKDLPLLLSNSFMKRANMVLDFKHDAAYALGETVNLSTTTSGHYTIPISKPKQLITNLEKLDEGKIVLISRNEKSNREIAVKLHRQFAHPSLNQLLSLINNAGSPWKDNEDLKSEIKRIDKECTICQVYRKAPPRPIVGLPMSTKFLETVAMDLKFYDKKIFIHLIDLCTRLSAATTLKDKNPGTIIESILRIWISVYGSCEKFLVDNGGEFANDQLISLAEQFGITIKTTAAESPWSNGIVERHNQTLSNMLDKVLKETDCNFDLALSWCINAKNSLYNVHGFSPYQLSIGSNPNLPTLLNDKPPAITGKPSNQIIRENLNALHKAREAFIESEHSERIRRALSHNVRTSGDVRYVTGDAVYYKRNDSNAWKGPGTVLGQDGKQILIKHGSYYVRVHPCRIKLVNNDLEIKQTEMDTQAINNNDYESTTEPSTNQVLDTSEESDAEPEVTEEVGINQEESNEMVQESLPINKENEVPIIEPKQPVKLKPKLKLKFRNKDGEWISGKIISRAGKVGGKHEGWFNVETIDGLQRAINFSKIKDIEIEDEEPQVIENKKVQVSQPTLLSNTSEVLQAKKKELESWVSQNVYTEENDTGQEYITLKWVITPKVIDGQPSTKARLVARGFEEDQSFRTDSPTCSKDGFRLTLTIIAAHSWILNSLDVKTAFLQGEKIERELYVKPPKEANTDKIWRLNKTVYGLKDASRSWYMKLRNELIKLGGKPNKLDQGIFIWFSDSIPIGIMACFVDDVLWAGNDKFNYIIEKLKLIFKIGSEQVRDFKYIGVELHQDTDGSILLHQNDYIQELETLELLPERKTCRPEEPANDQEKSMIRRIIGKLNWLAGMSRPEISFVVSDVSSRVQAANISDVKLVNKTIKFLKSHKSYMKIPKLNLNSLEIKVFTDASFNNLIDGKSQGGHLAILVDSFGQSSIITWNSNRIRRVVRSTLAAETLAFTDGADSAICLSKMLQEFLPQTIPIVCYTDSRSLFESAGSTKAVADRRLRVEISAIREMVQRNEVTIKWIDGKQQISDVLTKKGASPFSLMDISQSGKLNF